MKLVTVVAIILTLAAIGLSQELHRVNGVVKNKDFAVVPGLSLSIEKDGKEYARDGSRRGGLTDINGEFVVELEQGNYKITADGVPEKAFALHLNIDDGPKPDNLDLVIDTASICPSESPVILKSVETIYPPAARAVRAVGRVTVEVKIRPDGNVASAKAISGHPLLRKASESAAEQFVFESSNDENRQLTLAFIFIYGYEKRSGLTRFECPHRIIVHDSGEVLISND